VTPIVSAGTPSSTVAAQPSVIAYRPAVVGYTMTPSFNLDYGFSIMSRLHERVGDVASLENAQGTYGNGVWGRIGGQSLNANSGDRFSGDERTFFAQFGKDWTLSTNPAGGSTHAGVTVTIGSTSATFEDSARSLNPTLTNATGSVGTQAQSVGGYWTKYLKDGSYFDAVAQLTHYRNKFGDVYGGGASQNGVGTGLSGEVGKPFLIGSTTIAIEPQAQLMYQYLHLNGFDDGISPVSGTSSNALRGRAGFRIFKANLTNDTKTGTATPYFTADVLHDFLNPGNTSVDGASFNSGLSKTWYEVGVGVTTSMSKSSEMYANVKYSRNIGGDYRQGVFGQVGYRYSW
jgi:outer membrane autotransporter protein